MSSFADCVSPYQKKKKDKNYEKEEKGKEVLITETQKLHCLRELLLLIECPHCSVTNSLGLPLLVLLWASQVCKGQKDDGHKASILLELTDQQERKQMDRYFFHPRERVLSVALSNRNRIM